MEKGNFVYSGWRANGFVALGHYLLKKRTIFTGSTKNSITRRHMSRRE